MTQQPTDINIPNIEEALNTLSSGSKDVLTSPKACLFTLVIFARETRRVNYLQGLVETILDKFPCRIIFIQGDDQSTVSYCHATVSNVISGGSTASSGTAVTCDQIVIKASKDQLFRIPYIVIPHLVPDLPIYLLWGHNPFEERDIFPQLQAYASRVIFDSECSDNISLFCKEMLESLNTLKMDIMDVSWALVSGWRDMLNQLFDTSEKIKQLYKIKSVIIHYNCSTTETMLHPEIRALYLQAWLACRLEWEYISTDWFDGSIVIAYRGPVHPAVIALSPEHHSELPPGAISSIDIATSEGQSYVILRKPTLSQALVHSSSKDTCDLPFTLSLPNVHKGMGFMREIFFSKLGTHYADMLQVLSKINLKPPK